MKTKQIYLGDLSNEVLSIDFHVGDMLIQASDNTLYFWLDGDTSHSHNFSIPSALLSRIIKTQEEQVGDEDLRMDA
jgi:hypothetical protein